MKYTMKAALLYGEGETVPLMKIQGSISGSGKTVTTVDGRLLYKARIENDADTDVRFHSYVLSDGEGREVCVGRPEYAKGEEAPENLWSINHTPSVDHATLNFRGESSVLFMLNSQNYVLRQDGKTILSIIHNGIYGGWTIETGADFKAEDICGIFIFCRYIERENEFLNA